MEVVKKKKTFRRKVKDFMSRNVDGIIVVSATVLGGAAAFGLGFVTGANKQFKHTVKEVETLNKAGMFKLTLDGKEINQDSISEMNSWGDRAAMVWEPLRKH